MISISKTPPLVIGCHHKTGSNLVANLFERLKGTVADKCGLHRIVIGRPEDRKLPLSHVLNSNKECDCYLNIWFEHDIDVAPESIRLLHFLRHPAKWVRSAYLYHKKGAPSDALRWLNWRVFLLQGEPISYCGLLNRLDAKSGLAMEAVRSLPEILGTASAARTSSSLKFRHQISLEQVHENFEATMGQLCLFVGFSEAEVPRIVEGLRQLDLSERDVSSLPSNVTRGSSNSAELEGILRDDPLFSRLYGEPAADMGYELAPPSRRTDSIFTQPMVETLLNGKTHLLTSWQIAEKTNKFMRQDDSSLWWTTYGSQMMGCGHLMMHAFIQQMVDAHCGNRTSVPPALI